MRSPLFDRACGVCLHIGFAVRVVIQVERVKRVLSSQHQARVDIESLADGHDFSETLTRARFEEVRRELSAMFLPPSTRLFFNLLHRLLHRLLYRLLHRLLYRLLYRCTAYCTVCCIAYCAAYCTAYCTAYCIAYCTAYCTAY